MGSRLRAELRLKKVLKNVWRCAIPIYEVYRYRGYTLPYVTQSLQKSDSSHNNEIKEPLAVQAVTLASGNNDEPKDQSRVSDDEQDDDKYVTINTQDVNETVAKRNVDSNPNENDAGDGGYSIPDELICSCKE